MVLEVFDPSYGVQNYEKQGGNVWVIGPTGKLVILGAIQMTAAAQKQIVVVGAAAPGACTATGAAVGDRVLSIIGTLTAGGPLIVKVPGTDFEATISVINQIQQLTATDLHLDTFVVTLSPA